MHTKAVVMCIVLVVGLGTVTCQRQRTDMGKYMETSLQSLQIARCDGTCTVGDGDNNCKNHFGGHAKFAVVENLKMNEFIVNVLEKEAGVRRVVVDGRNKGFRDMSGSSLPFSNLTKGQGEVDNCIVIETAGGGKGQWRTIPCSEQSDDIGHVCKVYYRAGETVRVGNHVLVVDGCGKCSLKGTATAICSDGKGKPAKVQDAEINAFLLQIGKGIINYRNHDYIVIDAIYDPTTRVWSSSDGRPLPYTNFDTAYANVPTGDSKMCAAIQLKNSGKWMYKKCSEKYSNSAAVCDKMIDECANNEPGCAHKCYDADKKNDLGGTGHLCSCNPGYKLMDDKKGCTKE